MTNPGIRTPGCRPVGCRASLSSQPHSGTLHYVPLRAAATCTPGGPFFWGRPRARAAVARGPEARAGASGPPRLVLGPRYCRRGALCSPPEAAAALRPRPLLVPLRNLVGRSSSRHASALLAPGPPHLHRHALRWRLPQQNRAAAPPPGRGGGGGVRHGPTARRGLGARAASHADLGLWRLSFGPPRGAASAPQPPLAARASLHALAQTDGEGPSSQRRAPRPPPPAPARPPGPNGVPWLVTSRAFPQPPP